jgi:DNA replication protein DnaC
MIAEQVRLLAHQLRLFGIHANFERRAAEALNAQMHPLEFLKLMLDDENLARRERVAKSLATRAGFRSPADLEDWDATFDRGIPKARLRELASLGFFHNKENLLLLGRTGEGKTHLAVSLGRRLCADGIQTIFMPVNLLFEEVAAAKASGGYLKLLKRLNKSQALILDDFGLRAYTHQEATVLVDLLEDRYRHGRHRHLPSRPPRLAETVRRPSHRRSHRRPAQTSQSTRRPQRRVLPRTPLQAPSLSVASLRFLSPLTWPTRP